MAVDLDTSRTDPELGDEFSQRLEGALQKADRERRRRHLFEKGQTLLLIALLVGPVLGWHLTMSSGDGVHLGVSALAWLAFLLDVGVHVDGSLLSYLGLEVLPSIVGVLLFLLVTATLLLPEKEQK